MNKLTSTLAGLALVAGASIAPACAQGTFTFPGPGTFTFIVSPGGFVATQATQIPVVFNPTAGAISTGTLSLSGGLEQFGAPGIAGTYTNVTEVYTPGTGPLAGFADTGTVFVSQRSATTYDLASDTTTFTNSGTSFDLVPGTPPAVPEASTTASFGLLLALGLGGLVVAARRRKRA